MRIHKILLTFLIFSVSCLGVMNVFAQSGGPVAVLQTMADGMIAGLKSNQATLKTKPQIVYKLAYRYVVPYADLNEMAKHVLPPQTWNSATPAQRTQFQKQFTTTLIRTYASALSNYRDQTIQFYPVRGGATGNTVEVQSAINSGENQPINVSYRMVHTSSGWRLYDLSVEGVSMLESFRSQFADLLSQGDMGQLLQKMSTHNDR